MTTDRVINTETLKLSIFRNALDAKIPSKLPNIKPPPASFSNNKEIDPIEMVTPSFSASCKITAKRTTATLHRR